jgi:Mg-chelatase subunit ChlD
MQTNNEIEISVLKGDKLFNQNTPFVININSPQPKEGEKKCNADLICVIDISGSMSGEKIELVKKSLKILVKMMDKMTV